MAKKNTEKIKIWGIVQGVGFRPYVAKVAERYRMKGEILNIGGLVEIVLTDTEKHITEFIKELEINKPAPAEIVNIARTKEEYREFKKFTILQSDEGNRDAAMIPADLAICPDCLKEMRDSTNARYEHPFISCMVCGPRYTIIDKFPYDRENTSMVDFPMCDFCKSEYTDINSRRYHAQTISCHECGPQMDYKLYANHLSQKTELEKAASLLKEGRVIAFKSMGGYNLIANPFDASAVNDLRKIKNREEKPFAIMFESVEEVKKYCNAEETEEKLLKSSARPIILLERKTIEELQDMKPSNYDEIAKSRFIGSFLPSMGAQYMLLNLFGGPLIVTSANISGMPIIKGNKEMFELMEKESLIAETFYNHRKIRVSVDDSVVRVIDGQPQMIRRSKGYAPVPLYLEGAEGEVLAVGSQLKNSFSVSKGSFAYMSQYFGNMDTVENQKIYEENVERMEKLFRIKPQKIVCDMHPLYFTTKYAESYAKENGLPILKVQHHHAHIASVIAEHALKGKIIGVSFDGTGYGTDGAIWGSEILICQGIEFERLGHLKYVDMIGGDESMKEGWKSALSYIHEMKNYEDKLEEDEFYPDLKKIFEYSQKNGTLEYREKELTEKALESGINVIKSSSMGRLFDGVSAMLGICDYNSYEGQCAIMLEDAAARVKNQKSTNDVDQLAYQFHMDIADLIIEKCLQISNKYNCEQVAISGGVFQNKILMEETLKGLREAKLKPYYNISVSPNDGGIALGQTYLATLKQEEK